MQLGASSMCSYLLLWCRVKSEQCPPCCIISCWRKVWWWKDESLHPEGWRSFQKRRRRLLFICCRSRLNTRPQSALHWCNWGDESYGSSFIFNSSIFIVWSMDPCARGSSDLYVNMPNCCCWTVKGLLGAQRVTRSTSMRNSKYRR